MKKLFIIICFALLAVTGFSQNGVQGVILEKYYISDANDATAFGLPVGSTTYRLWVDLQTGYKLNSVWGSTDHVLNMQSTTNFFNSPDFDKAYAHQIQASRLDESATMIDSWLSFGYAASGKHAVAKAEDTSGSYVSAYAYLQNADPLAGTAIKVFDGIVTGATPGIGTLGIGTAADVFDGTLGAPGSQFLLNSGSYYVFGGSTGTGTENLVLIAQITTNGYFSYELNLSVQNTTTNAVEDWVWNTPTAGANPPQFTASFMHFYPNLLPNISITAPAAGTSYTVNDIVHITANATDQGTGTIDHVDFYVNGSIVGTDNSGTSNEYSFDWTATPQGTYTLTAIATDNEGGTKTSLPVTINVGANTPPTVSITTPAEGATFLSGNPITITAVASDFNGGTVTQVEFFVDGAPVGTDASDPFSFIWTGTIGNHTLTAVATDNGTAATTSTPVHITVFDGAASYVIENQTKTCNETNLCMTISKISTPLTNCIGFDIILDYNPNKVVPTGIVNIFPELLSVPSFNASYTANIFPATHTVLISIFLSPSAPVGTSWHGTGPLCCVEFNKISGFGAEDYADFSITEFRESYYGSVIPAVVQPGTYTSVKDNIFTAALKFWNGGQAIAYDIANPTSYLLTQIWPDPTPAIPVTPDLTGIFNYDVTNGTSIGIHRDILNTTPVMPVINGQDAFFTKKVLSNDLTFVPSVYQIIAMDVNRDGVVSAGDLSQINLRTVQAFTEFKQAWNYGSNGLPLPTYKSSFDWIWVNTTDLDLPAYNISSLYPSNDGIGYSKYRVPVPDSLKLLPISSDACPIISDAIFQGVLIGDVNGNYKDIAPNGLIKGGSVINNDAIVLNLANAAITNNTIEIPVSVKSDREIHAADLALVFNNSDYEFISAELLVPGMQSTAYFSLDDETLRLTSFNLEQYPVQMTIMKLKFQIKNNNSELNITSGNAYTNGDEAKLSIDNVKGDATSLVSIYPNPSNDVLFVETTNDATVQLLDLTGKAIGNEIQVKASHPQLIPTDMIADGVYFLKVNNGSTLIVNKIVVSH
ncbi:MAG: Ig-like domain-containing protein [Bacteroidales bacterium]